MPYSYCLRCNCRSHRFDRAVKLVEKEKKYEEAIDIFSDLLQERCVVHFQALPRRFNTTVAVAPGLNVFATARRPFRCDCSVERYGQLCPLLGPIYFRYGDALLRVIEARADALAEGGGDGGEEDVGSGDEGEGANGAGDAGEDLTANEGEDNEDDETIAFENLDVARVIYSKMQPQTPVRVAWALTVCSAAAIGEFTWDRTCCVEAALGIYAPSSVRCGLPWIVCLRPVHTGVRTSALATSPN